MQKLTGILSHQTNRIVISVGLVTCLIALPLTASMAGGTQYVLNSFAFLIWGALVMWMCAGFTMLEAGSVRTKNASVICIKNIGLFSIACISYYVIGYDLMYNVGEGGLGLIGVPDFAKFGYTPSDAEVAMLGSGDTAASAPADQGHATMSDWFFQMVFVATTASIVSGALAERVRLWSFFAFILVLVTFIYPVVGAMTWGGGFLDSRFGFADFAGSTIVHSTGGWAALAGILLLGPRIGKFRKDGSVHMTPPSNVPIVTLGVFILWFGWLGFNVGSVLALDGPVHATIMSNVIANTVIAGAAGVIAVLFFSKIILGHMSILAVLNGAIAGLVAITAGPDFHNMIWLAALIGAIGGIVCLLCIRLFDVLKLDDVVSAIPAHLAAGIWGTLAVSFTHGVSFLNQLISIVIVGVFVFSVSLLVWWIIQQTIGLRISRQVEEVGQDVAELKIEAYPEFVQIPDHQMYEEDDDEAA
ncbi:MAG: ammonium transporter [Gammaproteobacteria bacterium]|nr:ammonium transporter [Gammaproteobacteria bacterium]MDE0252001.1 ammonium transporter [Gammaproteobacteria bacterium]MDE0402891.1 ammonium transporter [Gammaproteobacteria bacterium]